MTIIKPNSIAGITSITAQGDVINLYKSDGTLAGLQLNGVNFNTTSGVSTFNNVTVGGTITYQDVAHVDSVGIITAQQGLQVLANGLNVTGFSTVGAVSASNVNITGIATVGTALSLADNIKAQFGTGGDLQIYHDGSNNYIHNGNNGINNIFKSDYFVFQENQSGDYYIRARADTGAVDLYNQNTVRLSTADGGVVVAGVMTATSFSGDGSNLSGISVGLTTESASPNNTITHLDLTNAQDHKLIVSGITTISVTGGSEADSHTIRIQNSGISTVGFSTYFLFPSGAAPSLPTADGAISLISFTVHRVGAGGTQLLAGASVNYS